MKNKKYMFNFTDFLTKKDLREILKRCGYELMEKYVDQNKRYNPIVRYKNDDGTRTIFVSAKKIVDKDEKEFISDFISSNKKAKEMIAMLGTLLPTIGTNYFSFDKSFNIHNFYIAESMSVESDEKQIEFSRELTKIFDKYMTEKFGSFYLLKKKAYVKKLRDEENKTQTEQNNQ